LLYGAVKESRGAPFVFWGLVVIYVGGAIAVLAETKRPVLARARDGAELGRLHVMS